MNAAPPPLPVAPRKGWWDRHWKWAIPTLVLSSLTLMVGVILLAISGIYGLMKSSDVYQTALRRAQSSPDAIAAFGTPIEPGWWITGNINTSDTGGNAALEFALAGPKDEGDLSLIADKRDGAWVFSLLTIDTDAGKHIDLLTDEERVAATATFEAP